MNDLITEYQIGVFLNELREHGLRSKAAKAAGTDLRTIHKLSARDEDFAYQMEEAMDEAADGLEEEARHRAVKGSKKPVTFQGVITDTYREKSDSLLALLLKGRRREVFGDKREITGTGTGGAVQVVVKQFEPEDAPGEFKTAQQAALDLVAGAILDEALDDDADTINPDEFTF